MNALLPASTSERRLIMLELLSMTSPAATGTSAALKNVIGCGWPSSTTVNADCGNSATASDLPSNTLTCRTTRSDCALKTGTGVAGVGSCPETCNTATATSTADSSVRNIEVPQSAIGWREASPGACRRLPAPQGGACRPRPTSVRRTIEPV